MRIDINVRKRIRHAGEHEMKLTITMKSQKQKENLNESMKTQKKKKNESKEMREILISYLPIAPSSLALRSPSTTLRSGRRRE